MKKSDYLNFNVTYCKGMVDIDTQSMTKKEDFGYGNIRYMYSGEQGSGIQVNDIKNKKNLKKMCDKITNAIYEYTDKVKEEDEKR